MATTLTELPIVDMSLVDGDDTDRAMFRQSLLAATHEVGFFYLVGHGIDRDTRDRLFDTVRAFFALPEAAKFDVEMLKSPHFRGYTRFGGEYTQGAIDWREQIDLAAEYPSLGSDPGYLRLDGPNLWPELAGFREVITDWQKRCGELGLRLMREWASSLGTDRAFFDDAFAQRPSTLMKLVRYPGREDAAQRQGVGAHKDPGVLTLLLIEPGKGGLQVEHDGGWIDAPPVEDAFVVNIGELLEVATGGVLRATRHRVQSPPPGKDRVSVPFFYNPGLDAQIPVFDVAASGPGVELDPGNPIFATYGENAWKSRVRAHPDVAQLHHGIVPTGVASAY